MTIGTGRQRLMALLELGSHMAAGCLNIFGQTWGRGGLNAETEEHVLL